MRRKKVIAAKQKNTFNTKLILKELGARALYDTLQYQEQKLFVAFPF